MRVNAHAKCNGFLVELRDAARRTANHTASHRHELLWVKNLWMIESQNLDKRTCTRLLATLTVSAVIERISQLERQFE